MKYFLTIMFAIALMVNVYADDVKYLKEMKKNIEKISEQATLEDLTETANNFERIAKAEKNKWLPYYYAAYCQTILSFIEQDLNTKDIILDKADELIAVADSLEPNNSEIFALQGMIAQGRLVVDPMGRWMKFGGVSETAFTKALEINPENPRPYYLRAMSVLNTPEQFGGGKKAAFPIIEEAYNKYQKFVPGSDIEPIWGRLELEKIYNDLKAETGK